MNNNNNVDFESLPTTGRLLKATALAAVIAGVLLVAVVLPAEYGLDPIGTGKAMGLDALTPVSDESESVPTPISTPVSESESSQIANASEKEIAAAAFGVSAGQSFSTQSVQRSSEPLRRDTMEVRLEPGKGAEVKSDLKAGASYAFHWTSDGDVAVDMHGESPLSKKEFTSYWVNGSQREGSGTFVAPFDGSHGWYWLNRSDKPVTVQIEVVGFQDKLYRPGVK